MVLDNGLNDWRQNRTIIAGPARFFDLRFKINHFITFRERGQSAMVLLNLRQKLQYMIKS